MFQGTFIGPWLQITFSTINSYNLVRLEPYTDGDSYPQTSPISFRSCCSTDQWEFLMVWKILTAGIPCLTYHQLVILKFGASESSDNFGLRMGSIGPGVEKED